MTMSTQGGLLGSSAVMAAGTVVSRITGFAKCVGDRRRPRSGDVTADTFNVPNVIPTTLYILVGGGILNSVLVPVLVRAIKEDADGGDAYSQRLFSVVVAVLGIATVVCVRPRRGSSRAFVNSEVPDTASWNRSSTTWCCSHGSACHRSSSTACTC